MKVDKDTKKVIGLFTRYIFIFLLGLGNLYLFYKILTPLTIGLLVRILSIFRDIIVDGTFIVMGRVTIAIVPACVAGAAFYLMFILVFSTADVKPKKRFLMLVGSVVALFALNILRILFLILLIGQPFFDVVHWLLWNIVSTLFVVLIWVAMVYLYDVRSVPVYSDFKYILSLIKKA